ncbi:hypothetical protein AZI86_08650 [Bdellovibrio bacteriovorus]|uniref:Cytochrome c domain-containing protein n=1 Tax=Bdellovibrio bacteriovorus TaxID=959 RepID=A0A150WRI3_BDEBC|nr:hypothetical protein [Bdellovibrio bacteriovorus]KYG67072.1 hypothetical protein AZI86_08650 [Bdellovibrio bacteriovorus]
MKIIALFLCLFALKTQAAWDLNDVSYLMPLPQTMQDTGLLKISAKGRGGDLIPGILIDQIPFLSPNINKESAKQVLRVFGVRIDPCFPLPTPQSCQRQLRIVWQPIEKDFDGNIRAVDAALHSFYILTDKEFNALLTDIAVWKKNYSVQTEYLPLQVHPAWQDLGTQSPPLAAFHQIVLKYAGKENLSRVTAMLLRRGGLMWTFAGYEVVGDDLQVLEIPRLEGKKSQTFINLAYPPDKFSNGGINPLPQGSDVINTLVLGSDLLEERHEETIRNESRAAYRMENPKAFNPENMDCASCHVAQPAIHWVLNQRPNLKVDQIWNADIYKNLRYNLENKSPGVANTRIIRAFGYFDADMAISQRVINESAEVADSLNQLN